MALELHVLPERNAGAAENMSTDFLLLQRYPVASAPRFRHYGWHRPAVTFGYSQKLEFVRAQLPPDEPPELCRRPSGGGVVDHRNDWTYALVIPRGHTAYDARALDSYRVVHACLSEALVAGGQPARLQDACEPKLESAACVTGVCFTRAELFDVVRPDTGAKVAGAAQKRNKHGLLFQGSVARGAVREDFDWALFEERFVAKLADALGAQPLRVGWPDWSEDEAEALREQYASPEWNAFR